jgi:hypothetical protein
VRLFCGWLQDGADERALGVDPLADLAARDYAARDFKRFSTILVQQGKGGDM